MVLNSENLKLLLNFCSKIIHILSNLILSYRNNFNFFTVYFFILIDPALRFWCTEKAKYSCLLRSVNLLDFIPICFLLFLFFSIFIFYHFYHYLFCYVYVRYDRMLYGICTPFLKNLEKILFMFTIQNSHYSLFLMLHTINKILIYFLILRRIR